MAARRSKASSCWRRVSEGRYSRGGTERTREIPETTVVELFEQQVRRTPEAVAVVSGEQVLNYRELNERVNRLAHLLIGEGIGPEICVGLCLERSIEMVVGMLGILKAGAAYLPLDTDYPLERLSFMLETAHVPIILDSAIFARSIERFSA